MPRELTDGWHKTTLGHITDIVGGSTPSKADPRYWNGGTVPWATPSDITKLPAGINSIEATENHVTAKAISETSLRMLPPGSIMMTSRATIGYVAVNAVPMATNQGFANFLPSNRFDVGFLLQWLRFHRPMLKRIAGGSTFPEISKKVLRSVEIDLPPLIQQSRIGDILSSVDEAIYATQAVIDQTRTVQQSVLQRLLTKGIGHTRFKQTRIGELPESWKICTLGQIGLIQSGRQRSPVFTKGVERPYLRVANVFDGYIDTSDVLSMPFTDSEFNRHRLRKGDILLNEGQSIELVGRNAIYQGEPDNCCFQNTLIRFRANTDVNQGFAYALMQHLFRTGQFSAIASRTTSVAHLGLKRFAGLQVGIPTLSEQTKIGNFHETTVNQQSAQSRQLENLINLKSALVTDLLTGRVSASADFPMAAE